MRKITLIALSLITLALTACDNKQNAEAEKANAPAAETSVAPATEMTPPADTKNTP